MGHFKDSKLYSSCCLPTFAWIYQHWLMLDEGVLSSLNAVLVLCLTSILITMINNIFRHLWWVCDLKGTSFSRSPSWDFFYLQSSVVFLLEITFTVLDSPLKHYMDQFESGFFIRFHSSAFFRETLNEPNHFHSSAFFRETWCEPILGIFL